MKQFVTDNGSVVDVAYIDGYLVAERLLEGVLFECRIQNDTVKVIGVEASSAEYFKQFNEERFLREAQACADDRDVFQSVNGNDCWIEES